LISPELDMAFNPDGSVNEIQGTMRDVVLERSPFTTSYPVAYDPASLKANPWIARVMEHAGKRADDARRRGTR
jgi:hypothetical protein